jgi:hypothetical protein
MCWVRASQERDFPLFDERVLAVTLLMAKHATFFTVFITQIDAALLEPASDIVFKVRLPEMMLKADLAHPPLAVSSCVNIEFAAHAAAFLTVHSIVSFSCST